MKLLFTYRLGQYVYTLRQEIKVVSKPHTLSCLTSMADWQLNTDELIFEKRSRPWDPPLYAKQKRLAESVASHFQSQGRF